MSISAGLVSWPAGARPALVAAAVADEAGDGRADGLGEDRADALAVGFAAGDAGGLEA